MKTTRILIVDDKDENLCFLRALLQGHGCEVDEARNGAEALSLAHQVAPQLIISDLLMPVMDGYTLLRHWRSSERLKNIPFIVYTATYTGPKDERLAMDLGADAFIIKPVEPEPFMAQIQALLAKADHGELPPAGGPKADEKTLLKEYSEVLIWKLDERSLQLEEANRALQQEIDGHNRTEEELRRRNDELERFNRLSVGRELRMIELKKQVNELARQLGRPAPYPTDPAAGGDASAAGPEARPRTGGGA